MEVRHYISQKFGSIGVSVSDAELLDVLLHSGLTGYEEVSEDMMPAIAFGLTSVIPLMLASPRSVSEGGVSVSWDPQGLRDYYKILCGAYGIDDTLSDDAKVTFL